MEKQKAIIVDIDGTIADMDHRLAYKKDKEKFYDLSKYDKPMIGTIDLVKRYAKTIDVQIIFVTSRPEFAREITMDWLEAYVFDVSPEYNYIMHMRPEGDHRQDSLVKRDIYEKHVVDNYEVLFVIEDRKRVVDMWRSIGLLCLQTCEGNY